MGLFFILATIALVVLGLMAAAKGKPTLAAILVTLAIFGTGIGGYIITHGPLPKISTEP